MIFLKILRIRGTDPDTNPFGQKSTDPDPDPRNPDPDPCFIFSFVFPFFARMGSHKIKKILEYTFSLRNNIKRAVQRQFLEFLEDICK